MKKYQCIRTCYASLQNGEKHRLYEVGETVELPDDYELPKDLENKFICLSAPEENVELDLFVATKEQLLVTTLAFKDLKEFVQTNYGYDLEKAEKSKEEIVNEFLKAREDFELQGKNPNQHPDN